MVFFYGSLTLTLQHCRCSLTGCAAVAATGDRDAAVHHADSGHEAICLSRLPYDSLTEVQERRTESHLPNTV